MSKRRPILNYLILVLNLRHSAVIKQNTFLNLPGPALLTIVFPLFLNFLSACTTHTPPNDFQHNTNSAHSLPHYPQGSKPFQFKPDQVKEITIIKSDPITGDRWTAILQSKNKPGWEFTYVSDNFTFSDRKANDAFINHLLDSLQTLSITGVAPHGTLDSLGLDPPRFAITWKTNDQQFQFQLGAFQKEGVSAYFTTDGTYFATVSGSTLKLLSAVDSISWLRDSNWSSFSADDVDEIELKKGARLIFYAQRDGIIWADQNHKPVKKDVESLLEQVTSAQAIQLIDDSNHLNKLNSLMKTHLLCTLTLRNRGGHELVLKVIERNKEIVGSNSDRPFIAFLLNPKVKPTLLNALK